MCFFYMFNDVYVNNFNQWFFVQIDVYDVWDLYQEGEVVVVVIMDDVVKWDYEDLEGNFWINDVEYDGIEGIDDDGNGYIDDYIGWDVANWDNDFQFLVYVFLVVFFYGIYCVGIVGGVIDNWVGGVFIFFNNVWIMLCKGKIDGIIGIEIDEVWGVFVYVVVVGVEIISCLWGGGFLVVNFNFVSLAIDNGVIVVVVVGNDNILILFYFVVYIGVLVVVNICFGDVCNISFNYGYWVDIVVLGMNILSLIVFNQGSYDSYNGIFMFCLMVVGLLVYMKFYKFNVVNEEIVDCLLSSVDNIDVVNFGFVGVLGSGCINVWVVLECLDVGGGGGGCNGIVLGLIIILDDYGDEIIWGVY